MILIAIVVGVLSFSFKTETSVEPAQDEIAGLQYDKMIPLVLDLLSHYKAPVETYHSDYTNWLAYKPKDIDQISRYHIQFLYTLISNDQFFQIILSSVLNEEDSNTDFPITYEDKIYLLTLAFTYHDPEAEILADIKAGYDPLTSRVTGILDRLDNKTFIFDFDHADGNHNQNHSYHLISLATDDQLTTKLLLKKLAQQSYFNPQTHVLTIITKGGSVDSDYLESKYRLQKDVFVPLEEDVSLRGDAGMTRERPGRQERGVMTR